MSGQLSNGRPPTLDQIFEHYLLPYRNDTKRSPVAVKEIKNGNLGTSELSIGNSKLHKDCKSDPERKATRKQSQQKGVKRRKQPTTFLDLTEKIRFKILGMIPTSERVWLQLVCRSFRDDIRVCVGIPAFVCESTIWGLSFFRDLVCDTIAVGKYQQPTLKPPQLILRGGLVKHLKFDGSNSVPYMDAFLARCRQITRLSVNCEVSERSQVPASSQMKRDYKAWRRLELIRRRPLIMETCKMLEVRPQGRLPHLTVQWTLELCNYIALVKVCIVINEYQRVEEVRKFHMALLEFVGRHPKLEHVFVDSKVWKTGKCTTMDKTNFLRPERDIVNISRGTQLRQLTVCEENVDFQMWGSFMLEQNRLEVLQVIHCCKYPAFLNTIVSNASTLRKIALHTILEAVTVTGGEGMVLDFRMFHDCNCLKELYIYLANPSGHTDLTNFKYLPKSLDTFVVRNVTFHYRDFINVGDLPNLRVLGATVFPKPGPKTDSLSGKLIRAMLGIRKLDEIFLQGLVASEESTKLMFYLAKLTKTLLKCQKNTLYIRNLDDETFNRWQLTRNKNQPFQFTITDEKMYEV